MKFIIRDDDLNYFSTPADIERGYADIFAQNIPVGFAAVPFITNESDVYTADVKPEREYPIHENSELVSYVRQNPHIEILQHGTTHGIRNGVYEYQNPSLARTEALRGRKELEEAFGIPVPIFVPPHDWIGVAGIRAIEYAKLNVIRGRGAGLRNLIMRPAYVVNFVRMLAYRMSHANKKQAPAYPYVLNFGKHKELCSYRIEDPDIEEGLAYAHKWNGVFVVVLHVHFITEEKKALLMKLITKAREYGAEFVRPSAMF